MKATKNMRALAGLALVLGGASVPQPEQEPLPAPEPKPRAMIDALLAAGDEEEQRAALRVLERSLERTELVQQLFLFSYAARDTREAMLLGSVIAALRLPPLDVVSALLPFLESSDPEVRAAVGGVFSEYEHRSVERGADLSVYRPILEARLAVGEPPPGLVRHLFSTDPGAALLLVARLVSGPAEFREILWAEHVVADVVWKQEFGFLARDEVEPAAAGELQELALHARWYARLYAAVIARRYPAFQPGLPLEELKSDAHPLVRAIAAETR